MCVCAYVCVCVCMCVRAYVCVYVCVCSHQYGYTITYIIGRLVLQAWLYNSAACMT